ncbi:hypothetical protein BK143_09475 [Paenibacillus peoriae]|uniref:hypothetical protein n=1 Tax=Paenibacillus peoriae TaxID=59893 RepID=UPI00096F36E5|nr:hypothetical protein [Paenibacillus peoriae]OMF72489.1 hypothetical protein BK143_09475 [Paenibacillus peoriae]
MDKKTIFIIIGLGVLFISTLFIEIQKYKKLKKQIESPLNKVTVYTQYLFLQKETILLSKAYAQLYTDSIQDFKTVYLDLKILKEKYSSTNTFDDLLKMITTIIPLITIVVTLSIATFKNPSLLLNIFSSALDLVIMLSGLVMVIVLINQITNFSSARSNSLINKHLIIAEETLKEFTSTPSAT